MSNEKADLGSINLTEINALVKQALKAEFGIDVGFKTIDKQTATSYIVQVALQRVKQRTKGKEDRELTKKMKKILEEKGIKF